jgi:hypothetical protein
MSTTAEKHGSTAKPVTSRIANKVWREVSRPVRQLSRRIHGESGAHSHHAATAYRQPEFDPKIATIEPEAIPFIQRLVRESRQFSGPIIEIGTLLGVTTTHMALAKAPEQKIITVDLYCWNPWGVTPAIHEAHTAQMLHYLVETGHVERVRMDKDEFFAKYRGPAPAMVFLDAMHDYKNTKLDIEWAQRVGAKIISGHDYCDLHPGVIQIVDELGGPRELGGSVWVL